MAPTPADAPAMVEQMLTPFPTAADDQRLQRRARARGCRPDPRQLAAHARTAQLDLSQAAAAAAGHRQPLRPAQPGQRGRGRGAVRVRLHSRSTARPFPLQATLIFEYKLPASTDDGRARLGQRLARAGRACRSRRRSTTPRCRRSPIGSPAAARGPAHPNGNAINAVRTNEIDFGNNGIWQLREFGLSPTTGTLVPATIKLTPDLGFNNSATLASFINANEAAIIAETHTVPEQFQGAPFLGGAVFNDFGTPGARPGINNNEARHHFALNTCNGCHSTRDGRLLPADLPALPGQRGVPVGLPDRHHGARSGHGPAAHVQRPRPPARRSQGAWSARTT